jgi:hypothetical protein
VASSSLGEMRLGDVGHDMVTFRAPGERRRANSE